MTYPTPSKQEIIGKIRLLELIENPTPAQKKSLERLRVMLKNLER